MKECHDREEGGACLSPPLHRGERGPGGEVAVGDGTANGLPLLHPDGGVAVFVDDLVTRLGRDRGQVIPLLHAIQEHFRYLTKASETYERGDQQVFVLKSVTPKPSDNLTLSDGVWRVLSAQDEGTLWSLHVRRA